MITPPFVANRVPLQKADDINSLVATNCVLSASVEGMYTIGPSPAA